MPAAREKIVYISTYGPDTPEKATLPFILANAALAMEVEAFIALQGPAVFLARKGVVQHVKAAGLPPLKDLMKSFIENGGKLGVCTPCIREREIGEFDLIEGAFVVAAARITEEILSAKATLVY